jgi:hypothetical protein
MNNTLERNSVDQNIRLISWRVFCIWTSYINNNNAPALCRSAPKNAGRLPRPGIYQMNEPTELRRSRDLLIFQKGHGCNRGLEMALLCNPVSLIVGMLITATNDIGHESIGGSRPACPTAIITFRPQWSGLVSPKIIGQDWCGRKSYPPH